MILHVHRWDGESDSPSLDTDAEFVCDYGDYLQFVTSRADDSHVEIRLPITTLLALARRFLNR